MEIKVLYNKNGEWGEEIAISLNDRIVFSDNMFENTLGERGISFEQYKVLPLKEKLSDLIFHTIDLYYYNGKDFMLNVFKDNFNKNINDFEVVEVENVDKEFFISAIKFSTKEKVMETYQDEIINNIFSL